MKKNNTLNRLYMLIPIYLQIISFSIYASTSFTVPSEGIKTINEALVRVKPGDTIWVKPGIYKEHINLTSGITLISSELFKAVIDDSKLFKDSISTRRCC